MRLRRRWRRQQIRKLSLDNMINLFDVFAPFYELLMGNGEKSFKKIEKLGAFTNSDVVVDIGGGTGRVAKFLVGKVKSVTVIDPSRKMIEQCQKHAGISCVSGEGENLPLGDNSADKIILMDAFHHIQNQLVAIGEIARIIKLNGKIIIEEFNPATFSGVLIVILEKILRFNSKFYQPKELAELFSNNNFKVDIIDSGKVNYYIVAEKVS